MNDTEFLKELNTDMLRLWNTAYIALLLIKQLVKFNNRFHYFIFSVVHKTSKEETIALNVMLLEQRVRKVVVVVTKYAHMLQKVSSDIYLTNF